MFKLTPEGHPALTLGDMRAGHWPGIKCPPWGLQELAQAELVQQFGLSVDATLDFPAVLEGVPVQLRRHLTSPGQESIFAFPRHPLRKL